MEGDNRQMPARLKDIAHDLGLSVVTISKVVRDHPDIGAKTRKRVLKRMKELNYRPNLAARSLITGHSWAIGIVVPDLLQPTFAQIAQVISAEVRKHGYSLFISSSEEDPKLERQEMDQLLARSVDVMLIVSAQGTHESFHHIEEQKIPYILLYRQIAGLECNFVGVNDKMVGDLAATHLIEQGCRRIAHIRGPKGVSTAIGRLEGYKKALAAHRMVSLPGHIVSIGSSGGLRGEIAGYEMTKKLLANKMRPDGIFCFDDTSALGAMRAILDAGLRIPEDVAVVGCGNTPYSDFLRIPLTSVDIGSKQIGKRAAVLALRLAHKKVSMGLKSELIAPQIVVRASSLRKPAAK
jgi:LacI family transcriptional regulator